MCLTGERERERVSLKMCSIHHLLINCIIFFHLAPQLTLWTKYSTNDHPYEFYSSNHDLKFRSMITSQLYDNLIDSDENSFINHLTYYSNQKNDHLSAASAQVTNDQSDNQSKFVRSHFIRKAESVCLNEQSDHEWSHRAPVSKSNSILSTFITSLHLILSSLFKSINLNASAKVNSLDWPNSRYTVGVGAVQDTAYSSRSAHRTLRMFQTHACEGDNLHLTCPKNSAISIYSAHFGGLRSSTEEPSKLCPSHMAKFNLLNERLVGTNEQLNSSSRCSSVQAFRIVDSKCRDNRTCTIQTSIIEFLSQPNLTLISEQEARKFKQTTEIMIDLCSSDVTYSEAMWKCKPTSILSKGICENENLHLNCPKRQVIHIYKAFYGPINEPYTAQCKSSNSHHKIEMKPIRSNSINDEEDECQVTNETEMLIEHCQGYRKCNLIASDEIFYKNQTDAIYQTNCKKRKRLKVHYTCTNAKILTDDYQSRQIDSHESPSAVSTSPFDDHFLNVDDSSSSSSAEQMSNEQHSSSTTQSVPNHFEIQSVKESKTFDSSLEDEQNEDANCTSLMAKKTAIGFVSEWIQAVFYMSGNLERLLLYFLVSILFALLCIVIVMSCRLAREKNRAKKCIKQQIPIFEYIADEDDENLILPTNTPQHYKQQLSALLNQQAETNNNTLQQPSRNTTRTMPLLGNTSATDDRSQPTTTLYGSQQVFRSSPSSQINPNYIHAFLNERELINRTDGDEDDEGGFATSPEFGPSLTVYHTTPIRSSFKAENIAGQLNASINTNRQARVDRPILIKDHASTIHIIRTSKPSQRSLVVQTNNRTALSSSTLSALLSGKHLTNSNQNQFSNLFFNDRSNDERRPMLSSSPNLHPMHALNVNKASVTPTSSHSANTTLTSANPSNPSSSPQEMTFSQRTTPLSKNRLLHFDTPHDSKSSPIHSPSNSSSQTNSKINSPSSPITNQPDQNDTNDSLSETIVETNCKRPAWLLEKSPVKQNSLARRSFDDTSYKKTSQTISSVGENLFD